ncbi:glutaredoxin-like protein NrdH [Pseudactinotalea sp. HY160]|uniref:glutaredoxin-like protein NrdH n=1 Tax=Pseudactinotalea sp. HY160 TaxID=2654490 RepID=UPI00351AD711
MPANTTAGTPIVTVYTTPSCIQCETTKRKLARSQIPYETVDLSTDADAMAMIKAQGFTQAPIVVARDADGGKQTWSGFRPDKIKELTKQLAVSSPALSDTAMGVPALAAA